MKALILAAGFGTRLLPYTENLPKPLFPVLGRPLIEILIERLIHAGCTGIVINTHHLHEKISGFISGQNFPIPVITCYEETLLGTGGTIENLSEFFEGQPFIVINGDIVTDIDLRAVYDYHLGHGHLATLVMHDYPAYNNVWVTPQGYVSSFDARPKEDENAESKRLAFTGIQVLSPEMIRFIPQNRPVSSIDAYRNMLKSGLKIKAFVPENLYWRDIGSPPSYLEAVYEKTAPLAFSRGFGSVSGLPIKRTPIAGDGSDRKWYRLTCGPHSLILAEHGIRSRKGVCEIDAFVAIGRHLHQNRVPVPQIYLWDSFSGHVYLEDLGDINLQTTVLGEKDQNRIASYYESVVDQMLGMWINSANSFDPAWAYQTPAYDKTLILERECRYFVDAFLNTYLGLDVSYERLKAEFIRLADNLLARAVLGLMHRDLQSRNIMVKDNTMYLIDFQGSRMGPIQYDLASLLIDPYVNLPQDVQLQILDRCADQVCRQTGVEKKFFLTGYEYCTLTRNLQVLGAFAHLSKIKHKLGFEPYIPAAIQNLNDRLTQAGHDRFPNLSDVAAQALKKIHLSFDTSKSGGL